MWSNIPLAKLFLVCVFIKKKDTVGLVIPVLLSIFYLSLKRYNALEFCFSFSLSNIYTFFISA